MEYREIVAVTGLGGLYQLLASKSDGAIVKNITDKTTKFISARLHNVTPLESIEIYTTSENVRLQNILQKMQEQEGTTAVVNSKADNNAIKDYFRKILPDFDEERVYVSDIKKVLKWYELLKENDLLHFEEPKEGNADETEKDTVAPEAKELQPSAGETPEEKPAKKAKAKKAAVTGDDAAEKPAKKTARKKKEE